MSRTELGTWSWRFGGHRVSLNLLVVDGEVQATTPCFLGADPAESHLLGPHLLHRLGGAEDLARDPVRSLDEEQARRALLTGVAPVDIVGGNRPRIGDGDMLMPLPDVWRGHFTEDRLANRVEAMHRGAEERAGFRPRDHEAVRPTARPKGRLGSRGLQASTWLGSQWPISQGACTRVGGRTPSWAAGQVGAAHPGPPSPG